MTARNIGAGALVALGVAWAGSSLAQTTTYEVKQGEVVKVQGNDLVVKTPEGYRAFNIPDDFRFQTEGQSLSVHELKPGMKLTAAIATTRTPVQVVTTELRNAEVINANGMSVVVKDQDGVQKIFTKQDFEGMGLAIYKGGEPATSFDLRKGDRITALIMKEGPPLVLEEKRVAAVAQTPPPPAKAMPAATTNAQPPPPPPPPAPAKTLPKTATSWPLVGLAGAVLVGLGIGMTMLRRLSA
jgi:hypothetical protein